MRRRAVATLAALLLIPGAAQSQQHPHEVASFALAAAEPANPTLEDLAFLRGCWEGRFESRRGPGTIEEYYTSPTSNVILGTTRFIFEGRTVDFEFSLIFADSTGIGLRPHPSGQASPDDFRLTSLDGWRAVFESPEHDYPKRIIYWTEADGTRVARIDGGAEDPSGREWRMKAVPCPHAGR